MRIKEIDIKNFKGFYGDYKIELDDTCPNLLIYGENGSGKSSLFYAIKYFFESSQKNIDFRKYENIFVKQSDKDTGYVKLTFRSKIGKEWENTPKLEWYSLGSDTNTDTNIVETNKTKAFLDYKNLLQTYLIDTEKVDIFNILINNIISDFENIASKKSFIDAWTELEKLLSEFNSLSSKKNYKGKNDEIDLKLYEINRNLDLFNVGLKSFLFEDNTINSIKTFSNKILESFENNLIIDFDFNDIKLSDDNSKFENNNVFLKVNYAGKFLPEHHFFLNEARLTAISISIFLSAILKQPPKNKLKILFLDDIFIGLDMSNRLPLLDILKEKFNDYQIFISTYDRHWFELAKRYFSINMIDKWKTYEFYVDKESYGKNIFEKPILVNSENNFNKAIYFLHHTSKPDYPASSNYFRKYLEELVQTYIPKYELVDTENTQIMDHKLTLLMYRTKNFLYKTFNDLINIETLIGFLPTLLHPLSHYEISSPIYKAELMIVQNSIQKLLRQLISLDIENNFNCILGGTKVLKITYKFNKNHTGFYEIILDEPILKIFNSSSLQEISLSKCRALKCYDVKNGNIGNQFNFSKKNQEFNYISLEEAYNKIYTYITKNLVIGNFPKESNYLDAFEYHDGTNWKPFKQKIN